MLVKEREGMKAFLDLLRVTLLKWTGVTIQLHRFGGLEFNLGQMEIGHVHLNGMVDIPFNRKLRDQLIAEGFAEQHHILPDTGWVTFYIRSEQDLQTAIWLFRLSYLFNASRGQNRAALQDKLNVSNELEHLNMSPQLRAIFTSVARLV